MHMPLAPRRLLTLEVLQQTVIADSYEPLRRRHNSLPRDLDRLWRRRRRRPLRGWPRGSAICHGRLKAASLLLGRLDASGALAGAAQQPPPETARCTSLPALILASCVVKAL